MDLSGIQVTPEAIVVIDMVEATATSDRFGWYAVGRPLKYELRELVERFCEPCGLSCLKNTGDGFLATFRNDGSAEDSVAQAAGSLFSILRELENRNDREGQHLGINIRASLHFGEVDVLAHDREGPNISFAFRIENVTQADVANALNALPPDDFPLRNYVLCSEQVAGILDADEGAFSTKSVGLFKLKGFAGYHELFLAAPSE